MSVVSVISSTSEGTACHVGLIADDMRGSATVSAVDKIKNAIEDVEGKAKEALGKVTGDQETESEGRTDQTKSDLKDAGEKVKDAFKN